MNRSFQKYRVFPVDFSQLPYHIAYQVILGGHNLTKSRNLAHTKLLIYNANMNVTTAYKTKRGCFYNCSIEDFINSPKSQKYRGKVNLIFTSPPFPLNRKKKYGNFQGEKYIKWIAEICTKLTEFLTPDGSIVIEVGNSWVPGEPSMSTLAIESLLAIKKVAQLNLCQQFIWYNTAKLPSPAQWVTIDRTRVKDSFTHIWWMSKCIKPKADNRNVLVEYSESMKKLIRTKKFNSGKRPSEHSISKEGFLQDNNGAIPSNVLVSSNTQSNTNYLKYCRDNDLESHPARMPIDIPTFFIKLLTDKDDLVFDPFGGSNTTGEAAQALDREWIAVELNSEYIKGSKGRFN
jgi:site-specific DNA-methyltransferase (cytosine-N4-specific)